MYPDYAYGSLDDDVQSFLISLGSETKDIFEMTVDEIRASNNISSLISIDSRCRISNSFIMGNSKNKIPIRVYEPSGDVKPDSILLYIHGGGWVFGTLEEADHICSAFCQNIPAKVISVGYSLSPENKFPQAIYEILAVYKNIISTITPGTKIFIFGESAGANMATVLSQLIDDEKLRPIDYQILQCPVVDLSKMATESYRLFGQGRWLSKRNMIYYKTQYLNNEKEALLPTVSPLLGRNLNVQPPTFIMTAEFDVLRDEGELYGNKLRDHGVDVSMKRYDGVIHSFMLFNKIFHKSTDAIHDCIVKFQERLSTKKA